jgi:glycosyltransferase involved in cell wall biosynthesis
VNITHVVENLERGGLERVVVDLAAEQRRAGHSCQIVCLFERGLLADEAEARGVAVRACHKRRGPDLRALHRARRAILVHGTEVLHSHNATAHYLAVLATTAARVPCIVNTRHGMGAADPSDRRERLYARAMPRTDAVVAVCANAAGLLLERKLVPESKLRVVPNGIDVGKFTPACAGSRQRLAMDLGFPSGTRLIGAVGRLNWAKDYATLIKAFALVNARVADVALAIAGDGEMHGDLRRLVDDLGIAARVRLLGDRSDIPYLLSGLEIYAMSSVTEGYSLALVEACAAGLSIVATRVGGNTEIVRDGVNGCLVNSGDSEAIAAALASLLGDPGLAAAMGRTGREWAVRNGSLEAMAAHYQELYDTLR